MEQVSQRNGWQPRPLENAAPRDSVFLQHLSAAMLVLTQTVALPLAVYARSYFKPGDPQGAWFWPLMGFLIAGLNALFVSADLFNIYVTLELVGLAAVGLVAAGGGAQQVLDGGGWRMTSGGWRLAAGRWQLALMCS